MKKMLLLNGSYNEVHLIHAAHKLGYYVITSGNDISGEGHNYANEYCPCDYSDKEAVYETAKKHNVDVICSCSNDFGALSAAYACEKLKIPGHDKYETSRYFHEKDCFKKLARELNLRTPEAEWFDSIDSAIVYINNLGQFTKIIKPSDLSGGKGIHKVSDRTSAICAVKDAFNRSKVKRILVEDYIEGQQQGITVFIQNKKVVLEYTTNDYAYVNPYMVWTACSPADHYNEYRSQIITDIENIAKEKNIADGFLTIQYILKDGKPYYIETMRRCLGNRHYLCMSKDTNIDFFELYVRSQCNEDCTNIINNFHKNNTYSGFMALFAPSDGTIKSVEINQSFQEKIFSIKMLKGPGQKVSDYYNDKIGLLYYTLHKNELKWFQDNMRNFFYVEMEK